MTPSLIHGLLVSALDCNCRGKQCRQWSNFHVLRAENWEPSRAVAIVIFKASGSGWDFNLEMKGKLPVLSSIHCRYEGMR